MLTLCHAMSGAGTRSRESTRWAAHVERAPATDSLPEVDLAFAFSGAYQLRVADRIAGAARE
jgi:hypothetical protein